MTVLADALCQRSAGAIHSVGSDIYMNGMTHFVDNMAGTDGGKQFVDKSCQPHNEKTNPLPRNDVQAVFRLHAKNAKAGRHICGTIQITYMCRPCLGHNRLWKSFSRIWFRALYRHNMIASETKRTWKSKGKRQHRPGATRVKDLEGRRHTLFIGWCWTHSISCARAGKHRSPTSVPLAWLPKYGTVRHCGKTATTEHCLVTRSSITIFDKNNGSPQII